MVTPENGSLTFRGASGRSYNINFYSSDVIGAATTFNLAGVATAGAQNFYLIPENVILVDISTTTGQTVTTNYVVYINDVPIGNVIPVANTINTLANRIIPAIPIAAGRKFTIIQA